MKAHRGLPFVLGFFHRFDDLFQGHVGAVVDLTAFFAVVQQRGIDERARIDNDVRLGQQPCAAHGDEVRRSAAGSDKMDHNYYPSLLTS